MKIAVAGTGYVGLVSAVVLASKGNDVTGIDVVPEKIAQLSAGKCPIYEPGLEECMSQCAEHLSFTLDYAKALVDADIIIIAVPTPEKPDGSAELAYVYDSCAQICRHLDHDAVVALKSTVPIGTGDIVDRYFREHLPEGVSVSLANNPEFLSQGSALNDMLHPSRIVVGAEDDRARDAMQEVYAGFDAPIVFTRRRSAEMIKYASNCFLALKISYIDEIAGLCEALDADIDEVSHGMGLDPRIGSSFLRAGIGYGGSCFPKDTEALYWLGTANSREMQTVKAAIDVNERQKVRLMQKAGKYYRSLAGRKVAVLGLTFKPDTDDLREAPSLANIPLLLDAGAQVYAWDPLGVENYKKLYPYEIVYADTIADALDRADLCLIFTEWGQICEMDPSEYVAHMARPVILDGRNCYSLDAMRKLKVTYDSIGRETVGTFIWKS